MPMFAGLFQSWRSTLSPQQALKLAQLQLVAASNADGDPITLLLCEQAEANLDRIKRPELSTAREDPDYQAFRKEVAAAYSEHASFMSKWKYAEKAQVSRTKSEKWGGVSSEDEAAVLVIRAIQEEQILFPGDVFDTDDARPTTIPNVMPEVNKPLTETRQLVYCLAVLNTVKSPEVKHPAATREWVQSIENDQDEQKRLRELAKSLVRAFVLDELKDADAVAEVTYMAPVLEKADFRLLLKLFINSIKDSTLLEIHSLEGIAQLLGSTSDTLEADDLVKTLRHVNANLQGIHSQLEDYIYRLTTTVSRVLDAMADSYVTGIERENLHQPLRDYLDTLKGSDDPYLVFHAAYAFQALLCVPNDESAWEATVRKTGRILNGVFQLVGAVKALDVNTFIGGLCTLQVELREIYAVAEKIRDAYTEVQSLYSSGRELKAALKDVSFKSRRSWYTALRGADTMLRNGHLAKFKRLVCEAPCRHALAFQWGVCLRMGNLAVDSQWDERHRCGAVTFLGHLYRDDDHWGYHVPVKQLIIDILMQLSKSPMSSVQAAAEALLEKLQVDDNSDKRAMLQSCLDSGPSPHPLMAAMSPPSLSALLDRAQGKVDVEADLKRLRLACEQRRVEAVYIPPKAKASLQAPDTDLFDLKMRADAFLAHKEQKVLLLLGESGIGKSTFNMRLEQQLWSEYKKHTGRIPLFINLPTIDRPDQDLIAKQLRKLQFEEPQIRELKKRRFVLICDGYDESQQIHNLYKSNLLDQKEEWQAQMVISCRSEYVGNDYKHQFQPGDRNKPKTLGQFQEAVVMPFDGNQIEEYIKSFVDLEKPLWSAEKYSSVLAMIPSLRELVKNPFLLKLSLVVLPRLGEPWQKDLTDAKVTRVALYDLFVDQWLEREKKRLVEKEMSEQERKAFQSLSDKGFALHGISFLKRLAADIYDKQGGNPVIEYSRVEVGGSWKDNYFSRDDNIQLLREACPLTKSGNQYRFIHRSILEYALARAVFEPRNGGIGVDNGPAISTLKRRGSVDSAYSFEIEGALQDNASPIEQGPDPDSPLARRYFVGEPSILQFLEERLQQEPDFRLQLLAYINASKSQKTLRIAAANAITILVRSGEQFNSLDLQGIRIPGANLSLGMFDSTQLQNADLRKVKLSSVWLGGANLSGARMSGVEFGEFPYLPEDAPVSRCIYSPDGNILMTILESGGANVYSSLTWEKKWSVDCTIKIDTRITFSPNSKVIAGFIGLHPPQEPGLEATWRIASESDACAVHLWETETGKCRTLQGHTARITGVAYSPRGDMVASCSDDDTIRLWNTSTDACNCSLYVPPVCSIAFSPSGDRLALACKDGQWWLWNVDTNTFIESFSFEAHSHFTQVLFSPTGTKVAIGGSHCSPNNIYLWDMQYRTRTKVGFINGHFQRFKHIVFSLKGDKLATISEEDGRVVIWNTETAESRQLLKSNGEEYLDAAFSPKGDLIATGGRNQIVRLWDVETAVCCGSMSGHSGIIRSVAFSPDGRHIASGSDDMQVRLWEVDSTTRINLGGSSHIQLSAGHSASGDSIFSVSGGETVHVWNMETGKCPQSISELGLEAKSIALSPSGNHIASGTTNGNIHLWDLKKGDRSSVLSDGDNDAVNGVAYSPNGDQIASCSGWAVKVWDTGTVRCLHNFSGHDEDRKIHTIAYSPKADQFASVAKDGKVVRLWDVEVGTCSILQGHNFWITSITYSPNEGEIASCSLDNTVRLWDTASGLCRLVLSGHEDLVYKALYSPNGAEIASCSEDNTVRLWNVETGTCRSTLVCRGSEGIASIAYSPAGDTIASIGYCETAQLWNVKTGSCLLVLKDIPTASIRNILFSPRGDLVAIDSGSKNGRSVGLWDIATGERRRTFKEFFLQASAPLFSPDGYQILCPESETTVRVWNVKSEDCIHTLVHEEAINDVQFSAKGDLIASASKDTTVKLWDAKSGLCLYTIENHRSGVDRIAFSPKNGDQIVLGCENGSIRQWDARSKTLTRHFIGHGGPVHSIAFSPNRYLVASGSEDTTVCLWDLETASLKRVFEGHVMSVQCVTFSPSGNHIASGSKDRTIRLWDVEEGTCCRTMTDASDEILCIAYSSNAELLASGSRNMTVRLWNVVTGETWMIIKGGYEIITSVAWGTANSSNHLVTGCSDSSVRVWRVVQEEGKPYCAILHWSSSHGALFVAGCDMQGVKGLTEANKRLLMQRGASGKPEPQRTLKAVATAVRATSTLQKLGKSVMTSEE